MADGGLTQHCRSCNGTGYKLIQGKHSPEQIPCENCKQPVNLCSIGHGTISFNGLACPLCAAYEEMRRLRGMLPSDVQRRDAANG